MLAYHGTRRATADALVRGAPFKESENNDDWLGHGIYFWEYAPRQAWWWAERRYANDDPAVVGAAIRLGYCLDFLDPQNGTLLDKAYAEVEETFRLVGLELPRTPTTTSTVTASCSSTCTRHILSVWHVRRDGRYGVDEKEGEP